VVVALSKKREYEELFNKIFGTSIKWSKLTVEELTQLATVLANPDSMCKRLCRECAGGGEAPYVTVLKAIKDFLQKTPYEGPIVKVARKFFGISGEEGEKREVS
jgi:hypothetical protein